MEAQAPENDITLLKIKRLIDAPLYSLIPVTLLFVIFSLLSGSLTILILAVYSNWLGVRLTIENFKSHDLPAIA